MQILPYHAAVGTSAAVHVRQRLLQPMCGVVHKQPTTAVQVYLTVHPAPQRVRPAAAVVAIIAEAVAVRAVAVVSAAAAVVAASAAVVAAAAVQAVPVVVVLAVAVVDSSCMIIFE